MALRSTKPATQVAKNAEAAWEAVLCVGVGMLIGYYADRWLGTYPVMLLVFTGFGCAAGFRRLMKLISQAPRYVEPEEGDDAPDR